MHESAIRFRLPPGEIAWEDAVHGRISFQGADIKDFIILRSDRTPIYNLAVVVDDLDMRITHVLRGDDHISRSEERRVGKEGRSRVSPMHERTKKQTDDVTTN